MAKYCQVSIIFLLIFGCCVQLSQSQWNYSPDETEVFDLVDETKANFYEYLNVTQDATSQDIRRSYRQLSRVMHPDKNKTEGAEETFRILVSMYEVLKNKEKREIYDNVLVNGLPASYLYVPRQLRKMGMLEASLIIALIATIGHFLFMWGSYVEKKLTLEEMLPRIQKRLKKQKKKGNDGISIEEAEQSFIQATNPKPTMYDVLPILMSRKMYSFAVWLPKYIKYQRELRRMLKEEEEAQRREEEETIRRQQLEIERREEIKKQKKERNRLKRLEMMEAERLASESGPLPPSVFDNSQAIEELEAMYDEMGDEDFKKKKVKKDQWDENDQSLLAKLMMKYPGGTPDRWIRISKEMGRSVNEITAKAKAARGVVGVKAKYSAVTTPSDKLTKNKHADQLLIPDEIISTSHDAQPEDYQDQEEFSSKVKRKQESREIKASLQSQISTQVEDKWEQSQQKLLELALQQYPKSTPERLDKIASCVPEKNKEECIARYRFLSEKIQRRRKQKS